MSREYAIEEVQAARKVLGGWLKDLKNPTLFDGDDEVDAYPDGVPKGLSVSAVDGIPSDQFQAELIALSGKLEALALGVSRG